MGHNGDALNSPEFGEKLQVIALSRKTTAKQDKKELSSTLFHYFVPFPLKSKPPPQSRRECEIQLTKHDWKIMTHLYKVTNWVGIHLSNLGLERIRRPCNQQKSWSPGHIVEDMHS